MSVVNPIELMSDNDIVGLLLLLGPLPDPPLGFKYLPESDWRRICRYFDSNGELPTATTVIAFIERARSLQEKET